MLVSLKMTLHIDLSPSIIITDVERIYEWLSDIKDVALSYSGVCGIQYFIVYIDEDFSVPGNTSLKELDNLVKEKANAHIEKVRRALDKHIKYDMKVKYKYNF